MFKESLASFRFYIDLKGVLAGWFSECTGLALQREVVEVREGGVNNFIHKLPGPIKQNNVTLKRGVTQSRELINWFASGLYDGKVQYVNLSILMYDAGGNVVRQWNLENAYPVKVSGPDLKADGKAVAIESIEIAYKGMSVT